MLSSESSIKNETPVGLREVAQPKAVACDYYVKLRQSKSGQTWRLPVPFSIGHEPANKVMISGMNNQYLIVVGPSGELYAVDSTLKSFSDVSVLRFYGLRLSGPFRGTGTDKSRAVLLLNEWLAKEQRLVTHKIPRLLAMCLGSWMGQPLRLLAWMLTAALLTQVISRTMQAPNPAMQDRSSYPMGLTLNQLSDAVYGSEPEYRVFAKGMTFVVANVPPQALVLNFDMHGIDGEKELQLLVGKQLLFSSSVEAKCLANWCEQRVVIPESVAKASPITLRFIHDPQYGDFRIRHLYLRSLSQLQPSELSAVGRWSAAAERHYRERDLAPENLLLAKSENTKVLNLTRGAHGVEQLYQQAIAREDDIVAALSELRSTLWFSAQRNQQLVNLVDARKDLQLLLRSLEPQDARQPLVQQELEQVERMLR